MIADLASAAGIPERSVHVRGPLAAADRAAVFGAALAFVAPSRRAAFPWRVVDALTLGVPVIAADSAVHAEVIVDGGSLVEGDGCRSPRRGSRRRPESGAGIDRGGGPARGARGRSRARVLVARGRRPGVAAARGAVDGRTTASTRRRVVANGECCITRHFRHTVHMTAAGGAHARELIVQRPRRSSVRGRRCSRPLSASSPARDRPAAHSAAPRRAAASQAADLSQFQPGNIISDAVFFNSGHDDRRRRSSRSSRRRCRRARPGYTCLKDWYDTSRTTTADAMCGAYSGRRPRARVARSSTRSPRPAASIRRCSS